MGFQTETDEIPFEDISTWKLNEYWTWPRNKAPPPKVQEGIGIFPKQHTDGLGFDQIFYS